MAFGGACFSRYKIAAQPYFDEFSIYYFRAAARVRDDGLELSYGTTFVFPGTPILIDITAMEYDADKGKVFLGRRLADFSRRRASGRASRMPITAISGAMMTSPRVRERVIVLLLDFFFDRHYLGT